jgi:hypothetical protein
VSDDERTRLFGRARDLVDYLSEAGSHTMCATVARLCARICELELELDAAGRPGPAAVEAEIARMAAEAYEAWSMSDHAIGIRPAYLDGYRAGYRPDPSRGRAGSIRDDDASPP